MFASTVSTQTCFYPAICSPSIIGGWCNNQHSTDWEEQEVRHQNNIKTPCWFSKLNTPFWGQILFHFTTSTNCCNEQSLALGQLVGGFQRPVMATWMRRSSSRRRKTIGKSLAPGLQLSGIATPCCVLITGAVGDDGGGSLAPNCHGPLLHIRL